MRFKRSSARGMAKTRRRDRTGQHALILLGAIALPAFAAPNEWGRFEIGDARATAPAVEPMPFEKAGSSFPGSAFYYLAIDQDPLPYLENGVHSDADIATGSRKGPTAGAMRIDNSGIDRTRALQCLSAAIYYEAASEPDSGQRAVAQVVLNRVAHPAYPDTICGVVYQGSERSTGCQFSFTCDGSLARKPNRLFWQRAEDVARSALSGYVHPQAGLATHYHTIQVNPYWAPSLTYLGTIGMHRFYRFGGRAGQPATFRFAYRGGEPVAAPHARNATVQAEATAAVDPVAVQAAFTAPVADTKANGAETASAPQLAPTPSYSRNVVERGGDSLYRANDLPEATGIKAEYRNSGRWIAKPGT